MEHTDRHDKEPNYLFGWVCCKASHDFNTTLMVDKFINLNLFQ